jgi:tRNA A-37 threonylcarbamoyl transferase component Bud32
MAAEKINRYEIGGRIASGGMAEIYAACAVVEPGIAKRVALKKILAGFCADPAFVTRFLDEARLAMRLSHANVVQVFDFGRTDEDQYFLAMEFVEGVDLKRMLLARPGQRVPLAEALHIAAQTLRGLDYAHRRTDDSGQPLGVVHRDVKPANVLLSLEGEVKLTDFGIARSRSGSQTSAAGDICGTIPFMSPEQAHGRRVDRRSDIFSVGTLLYMMASGVHPFEAENDFATLDKVRAGSAAPPSDFDLPPTFDRLVMRALAPDPAERYPTAGAFAEAVEEFAYVSGLRSGAASLSRHLAELFPAERQRLNGLFAPRAGGEQLEVARAGAATGYTQLSRVASLGARHRTQALTGPARSSRAGVAFGIGAMALLLFGGTIALLRARTSPAAKPATPSLASAEPAGRDRTPPTLGGEPQATTAITPGATQPATSPGPQPPKLPPASPRRRPAPAAMPLGQGTLTVHANPWGTVYLNQRFWHGHGDDREPQARPQGHARPHQAQRRADRDHRPAQRKQVDSRHDVPPRFPHHRGGQRTECAQRSPRTPEGDARARQGPGGHPRARRDPHRERRGCRPPAH